MGSEMCIRDRLYLISDEAAYMTGSMLTIDGGATLPVTAANDFE